MKRMTDIKEEILLSYFPDFLDTKMLKYVELKFKLEDELEKLTGWNDQKKSLLTRQTQKMMEEKFESIDKDSSITKFWSNNTTAKKVRAKELKDSVKNMIRKNISQEIVKAKKPIMIMQGSKFTGQIEWVECDKYGNEIDHDLEMAKNSSRLTLDLDRLMNNTRIKGNKSSKNGSPPQSQRTKGRNLRASLSGEKQARVIYLLNSVSDLSKKEAVRIFQIYNNKLLTVQTALNYYKICLVLFGNKVGGKEVSKFIKLKLVSK